MIETLGKLPGDGATHDIQAQDWKKLVDILPAGHSDVEASKIRKMFYPSAQDPDRSGLETCRRSGFLEALNGRDYRALYEFLIERPGFSFPNVHELLRTTKEDGLIIMEVMEHVVR